MGYIEKTLRRYIEKIKSDETLADLDPSFAWIQNDPNSQKRNKLMERYSFI